MRNDNPDSDPLAAADATSSQSPWAPIRIRSHGIDLSFFLPHTHDHIQKSMRCTNQLYEQEILQDAYSRTLGQGVIVDVGANIGSHTVFFAKVLARHVISLEPFQAAHEVLTHNVAINGVSERVQLLRKAAGALSGRGKIIAPPLENLGQARIVQSDDGDVPIVRLDDVLAEVPPALIKIDVEGMELQVLHGAKRTLEKYRPLLYIEARTDAEYAELRRFLTPLGYESTRRFNATPTYAFVSCRTVEDVHSVLLEKAESLTLVQDILIAQRELSSRLRESSLQQREESTSLGRQVAQLDGVVASHQQQFVAAMGEMRESLASIARDFSHHLDERMASVIEAFETRLQPTPVQTREDFSIAQTLGHDSEQGCAISLSTGKVKLRVPLAERSCRTTAITSISDTVSSGQPPLRDGRERDTALECPSRSMPDESTLRGCTVAGKVSVIMTAYNSSRFITAAIRSILDQTHRDLELIIVDDASTDDTFAVIQRAAADDPRVRPIKAFQNRGTYWCKNLGLTLACGEFVTFQDSDDVSEPARLQMQVEELRRSSAVICMCKYIRTDEAGEIVLNRGKRERNAIMAPLFRKVPVISRIGYFDSVRTSADDEFIRRIEAAFGQSRIATIGEPLYVAKLREGSLTTAKQTGADLRRGSGSSGDLSFLSVSRREYIRQLNAWHERAKTSGDYVLPFPLTRRRFPAPAVLLPIKDRGDDFVTASMASFPPREGYLKRVVDSILPQVDVLNVYLNGYASTPGFLLDKKIHVVHSREYGDLRDNGKFFFLTSLMRGYHFTIDDDIVYPSNYVQQHILKIEQYNRQAVVGCHGVIFANPLVRFMQDREVIHFARGSTEDRFVNLLGTGTTAYHVDTLELSSDDFGTPGMADLWLAVAAKRQGIPMIATERPSKWLLPLSEADDSSLYVEAARDDAFQTELIKRYGSWKLSDSCSSSKLVRDFLSRFSQEELRSRHVDLRHLESTPVELSCTS